MNAEAVRPLLARLAAETDETTRIVLSIGLAGGDLSGVVPTATLIERVAGGGPDAPLAALALARRGDGGPLRAKVDGLLSARDPVVRAHAARGIGASGASDAAGRLARAYAWETDAGVRRAIVTALAARETDGVTGARTRTLDLAARLDPDRVARAVARQGLDGAPAAGPALVREVAWLRQIPAGGATLPRNATGLLVQARGLALPIVFDDDGYALVAGVEPGEARLRLAPALPAYSAP